MLEGRGGATANKSRRSVFYARPGEQKLGVSDSFSLAFLGVISASISTLQRPYQYEGGNESRFMCSAFSTCLVCRFGSGMYAHVPILLSLPSLCLTMAPHLRPKELDQLFRWQGQGLTPQAIHKRLQKQRIRVDEDAPHITKIRKARSGFCCFSLGVNTHDMPAPS